jgi:hypothetical protein
MVLSRINKTIEYIDKKGVEEQDKNMKTELYEFDVDEYNETITIAIGKYNKNKNVLCLPIYLFYNEKFISQIGIFEYEITKENEKIKDYGLLDKNGNIVLERLDQPLFYSFFNKDFLRKCRDTNKQKQDKYEMTSATVCDGGTKSAKKHNWIHSFMKDKEYDLINTDMEYNGDADCLFTAIKIALSDVRKYVSVSSMRDMVAKNVTKSVYDMYKSSYDTAEKELKKIKTRVKELIDINKYYENKIKNTRERSEKIKLVKEAEDNITLFTNAKRELKRATNKYKDVSFMGGIDGVEPLKSLIKTNSHFADKWTISILERVMNIKIVLFSEEAYDMGDIFNVLDCVNIDNNHIVPDYYILISYINKEYQLITYRRQCAFSFNNLNDTIKNMIVNKIQERNAGIYTFIPDIQNYMKQEKIALKSVTEKEQLQSDLYSGETVFQIYEFSNDNYEPGKGVGERLDKREAEHYNDLRNCESWRRKLYQFSLYANANTNANANSKEIKNDEIIRILRNTKNAKIVYFVPKSPPILATMLMKMRNSLYNSNSK